MTVKIFQANKVLTSQQLNDSFAAIAATRLLGFDSSDGTPLAEFNIGDIAAMTGGSIVGDILARDSGSLKIYNSSAALQKSTLLIDLVSPAGAVMAFALETPPTGWLECDGAAVSRTTYSVLFAAIGVRFGDGDTTTTFNLPDLRGEFIRGWDNGAGNDPDAASRTDSGDGTTGDKVGTKQDDAFQGHHHDLSTNDNNGTAGSGAAYTTQAESAVRADLVEEPNSDGINGTPRITEETRPTNIYMMYCIKT